VFLPTYRQLEECYARVEALWDRGGGLEGLEVHALHSSIDMATSIKVLSASQGRRKVTHNGRLPQHCRYFTVPSYKYTKKTRDRFLHPVL
jgi:hypothetical protein